MFLTVLSRYFFPREIYISMSPYDNLAIKNGICLSPSMYCVRFLIGLSKNHIILLEFLMIWKELIQCHVLGSSFQVLFPQRNIHFHIPLKKKRRSNSNVVTSYLTLFNRHSTKTFNACNYRTRSARLL